MRLNCIPNKLSDVFFAASDRLSPVAHRIRKAERNALDKLPMPSDVLNYGHDTLLSMGFRFARNCRYCDTHPCVCPHV